MKGQELFLELTKPRNEYSQLLDFLFTQIGEDLFPLLEQAEAEGKKIVYDDSKVPEGIMDGFDDSLISIL
jgi:hypothetical protein